MSCCEVLYGQYILEEGDLSREALDELFGEDNYELSSQEKVNCKAVIISTSITGLQMICLIYLSNYLMILNLSNQNIR